MLSEVEMDRPAIDDQVDGLGLRIALSSTQPALTQAGCRHPVEIPGLHPSAYRVEKAHEPHECVSAVAVGQPGLRPPQRSPQPGLAGLTVEAGLITEQQDYLSWTGAGFPESLLQAPLFSAYLGSGLCR